MLHPVQLKNKKDKISEKRGPISWKNTVVLPFLNNISIDIKRIFSKVGIHTVFCIPSTLKKLFPQIKVKITPLQHSNVIYSIPCMGCDSTYVGQTSRCLKKRIYEHRRNIYLQPSAHTALTKHSIEFNHRFDFESVKISDTENTLHKRIILETLQMIRTNSMNIRYEQPTVHDFYAVLLKQ